MAGWPDKIAFAADCAFSEIYDAATGKYDLCDVIMDTDQLTTRLEALTEKYNFLYIEDPIEENDWTAGEGIKASLKRTMLVGDDLTVTNIERLKIAVEKQACKAFIFKPNQVGTVTESMDAAKYAAEHGILSIPSIRAGGVNDESDRRHGHCAWQSLHQIRPSEKRSEHPLL